MNTKRRRGKDTKPRTRRPSLDVILEREKLIRINPKLYNFVSKFMEEGNISNYVETLIRKDLANLVSQLLEEANND